jgi:hypothetical protein
MQPLFLSIQAIAAKRDEGLRPELIGLLEQARWWPIASGLRASRRTQF